ncbi:MAG: hypothetical protein HYW22_00960 [Candidatus Aenigmarchaeota archaeon]|nr:hypothetical protein [Candidatus Aenigmarchaeota archaeon]
MTTEDIIRRRIKKLKRQFPEIDEKQLERDMIPLSGENITIRKKKKII